MTTLPIDGLIDGDVIRRLGKEAHGELTDFAIDVHHATVTNTPNTPHVKKVFETYLLGKIAEGVAAHPNLHNLRILIDAAKKLET